MSLLNYQVHYNPTSHKDVLSKIRTFAVAQGWASDKYETSKDWLHDGAKYDWLAGNTDFLQLSSTGYGTNDLIFRFHFEGTGVDAQSEWCYFTGTEPGCGTPNDASSQKPYFQDRYGGSYGYHEGLPSGAHVALWLFGNEKFVIVVDQVSADTLLMMYFGTIEMFNTAASTFGFSRVTQWTGATRVPWYEMKDHQSYFVSPWDGGWGTPSTSGYWQFYWDGGVASGDRVRHNCRFTYNDLLSHFAFNSLSRVVRANSFTGKRVLIKPTVFGKRRVDDVWVPVGTLPIYRIVSSGLAIGEKVTYGTEEYLVFPNAFAGKKYGTAFRIV